MTSHAVFPHLPRILVGAFIGAVLGLLMLGVALAAWWLGVGRHEVQSVTAPDGFEARLEAAAGGASFGLSPVYVYDPGTADSSGAVWLAHITPVLEARGHEVRPVPVDEAALANEIERMAGRWAEPARSPMLIWRSEAGLMLCRCDHPRAWKQAVDLLTPSLPSDEAAIEPAPRVAVQRPRAQHAGKTYPELGPPLDKAVAPPAVSQSAPPRDGRPAPRLPGDPAPPSAKAATITTPQASSTSRASPARAARPRRTDPPEARRDAESLFF